MNKLKSFFVISLISFSLHFFWENFQCKIFFIHRAENMTLEMLKATLGDIVLTWVAFFIIAIASKSFEWIINWWSCKQWLAIILTALILSISIEKYALSEGLLSYTEIAPIMPFFKISLVPVFQLLILFPLTFWISALIFRYIRLYTV